MLLDNQPVHIVPKLLLAVKDHLQTALVYNVPEGDPTRAVMVKIGRFQENPIRQNVSVAIAGGDYEDPAYIDGRIDNPKFDNLQIKNLPVGEIGGGEYWWRRGTIKYQCYFVLQRFDEELAMNYAYAFQGRILKALPQTNLTSLPQDDYGEGVYPPIYVESATLFESGGADKFIWRGKISWKVLTWRY